MKNPKVINAVISEPWAATAETIQKVWMVVNRFGDPESLKNRRDASLENTENTVIRGSVAVISVAGPLIRYSGILSQISGASSYSRIAKDLGEALRNPEVKSILLDINSGGGSVDGCQELASQILDARKSKPVRAFIGGTGCSAAYWLASACEKIFAVESSLTGSIGVQLIVPPEQKDGSLSFLSSHSPNKNASAHKDQGKTEAQRIVDDLGEIFVTSVARNRGISKEDVLKNYGQGSVFVGPEALKRGLIDEIVQSVESLISDNNQTSEEDSSMKLSAKEIKEKYPEAYEQIFKLGVNSIDHQKIKTDSASESEAKERERVGGILELEGSKEATKLMISKGKSVGDAAIAFRKEEISNHDGSVNKPDQAQSALNDILNAERELDAPGAGSGGQHDEVSLDGALKLFENTGGYN